MPQKISKKILIYLFLFFIFATLNNKNVKNYNFFSIDQITIYGFNEEEKYNLLQNLQFLKSENLFFLDKIKIEEIINSNYLIEKYNIFKKFPSTIEFEIEKAEYLAFFKKKGIDYYLGSNGKFIEAKNNNINIPQIFGTFEIQNFFNLKKSIDNSQFNYEDIKALFYFPSGRWDIKTHSGILIKLSKEKTKDSLDLVFSILIDSKFKNIKIIDIRQKDQVVVNG